MITLKKQIYFTVVLGALSLFAGVLSHLALTDIYHAETDVTLEWNVLRISALMFLIFIGFAIATFRRTLRKLP